MKQLIIIAIAFLFLNCQKKDDNQILVPPSGSELSGTWKLVKVTFGFSQISVTGVKLPFQETLEFNLSGTWSYRRKRDGKLTDEGAITVASDEKGFPNQLIIKYLADNTYQLYTIEKADGKTILKLYERTQSGAVIADGSDYFYEKQ
jgi:hypothetical protein